MRALLRIQLLALVALAAAIRVAAYDIGPLQRADVHGIADSHLYFDSFAHKLATAVVEPFDPVYYVLIVVLVIGAAVWKGHVHGAVIAGGLMLGASATTQILKRVLAAPRPDAPGVYLPDNAWPSGHATAAASLAIALVLLAPPGRRRPVAIAAVLGSLVVGAALVALGRHYPSDVLGAYCVAGAWGAVAWEVSRRRARRAVS